jgi:hypothetical protein
MISLDHDIRRYWTIYHPGEPLRWQRQSRNVASERQRGGATMRIDGRNIEFKVTHTGRTVFVISAGSTPGHQCFALELDLSTHIATLQHVKRHSDCFTSDKTINMRLVVLAAYKYAKQKGMRRIQLIDISYITCPTGEIVHLADLSFLTTGRTWYESIIPGLICTSPRDLEADRRRAEQTTWAEIGGDLLRPIGIDPTAPGSARRVLQAIKADHDRCSFFAHHITKLMGRSGIESLYDLPWAADIPHPVTRSNYRYTRRSEQQFGSTRQTRSRRSNRMTAPLLPLRRVAAKVTPPE